LELVKCAFNIARLIHGLVATKYFPKEPFAFKLRRKNERDFNVQTWLEADPEKKNFFWIKEIKQFTNDKYEPALASNLLKLYQLLRDGQIRHACKLIDFKTDNSTLTLTFKIYNEAREGIVEDNLPLVTALIHVCMLNYLRIVYNFLLNA